MITQNHSVRQPATNTHRPHTNTHHRAGREQSHTETDTHTHLEWILDTSFPILPPPPPFSSTIPWLSLRTPLAPVAVTMCCRQRPQHVHCLSGERRRDTHTLCLWRLHVSLTASPVLRLSGVWSRRIMLLTIVLRPPSFLLLLSLLFFPLGLGGAVSIKNTTTEINKPLPLPLQLSPHLPLSPSPSLLQSQQQHTFPYESPEPGRFPSDSRLKDPEMITNSLQCWTD